MWCEYSAKEVSVHVFSLLSNLALCDQLSATLNNPWDYSTIFDSIRYLKAFIHLYSLKIGTSKEQDQRKLVLHRAMQSPQGNSKQSRQDVGKTPETLWCLHFMLSLLSAGGLCTLFSRGKSQFEPEESQRVICSWWMERLSPCDGLGQILKVQIWGQSSQCLLGGAKGTGKKNKQCYFYLCLCR